LRAEFVSVLFGEGFKGKKFDNPKFQVPCNFKGLEPHTCEGALSSQPPRNEHYIKK